MKTFSSICIILTAAFMPYALISFLVESINPIEWTFRQQLFTGFSSAFIFFLLSLLYMIELGEIDIYNERGYRNRDAYLKHISKTYSVDYDVVYDIANNLGHKHDFDELIKDVRNISAFNGS